MLYVECLGPYSITEVEAQPLHNISYSREYDSKKEQEPKSLQGQKILCSKVEILPKEREQKRTYFLKTEKEIPQA